MKDDLKFTFSVFFCFFPTAILPKMSRITKYLMNLESRIPPLLIVKQSTSYGIFWMPILCNNFHKNQNDKTDMVHSQSVLSALSIDNDKCPRKVEASVENLSRWILIDRIYFLGDYFYFCSLLYRNTVRSFSGCYHTHRLTIFMKIYFYFFFFASCLMANLFLMSMSNEHCFMRNKSNIINSYSFVWKSTRYHFFVFPLRDGCFHLLYAAISYGQQMCQCCDDNKQTHITQNWNLYENTILKVRRLWLPHKLTSR